MNDLERLTDLLSKDIDHLVGETVARSLAELPELLRDEPELLVAFRRSARDNTLLVIAALRAGEELPTPPEAALEEARVAAAAGAPLEALLQSYRVGQSVVFERAVTAVQELGLDPGVLSRVVRYAFAYVDRVTALVTETYARERDALLCSSERTRAEAVRAVLDGAAPDNERLDWPMRGSHVAVILAGDADLPVPHLAVGGPAGTTWAWVREDTLTRGFVGEPGEGVEGFRESHRQAREASRVGGDGLVRWRDVALQALALRDEPAARAFANVELGELATPTRRARELRETLRAWFDAGHSAPRTAAALGVHERTVTYRLATIAEKLGHPVLDRRAELDVALRIHG